MCSAKRKMIALPICLVLLILTSGVIHGDTKGENTTIDPGTKTEPKGVGDTIAILYPDDVELSVKILAKYIDLEQVLPYYAVIEKEKQIEAAQNNLELAQDELKSAKDELQRAQAKAQETQDDLDKSLQSQYPVLVEAKILEGTGPVLVSKPPLVGKRSVDPMSISVGSPPKRRPPKQIIIHPYRLEETAREMAKYFTKEQIKKHWPETDKKG